MVGKLVALTADNLVAKTVVPLGLWAEQTVALTADKTAVERADKTVVRWVAMTAAMSAALMAVHWADATAVNLVVMLDLSMDVMTAALTVVEWAA